MANKYAFLQEEDGVGSGEEQEDYTVVADSWLGASNGGAIHHTVIQSSSKSTTN